MTHLRRALLSALPLLFALTAVAQFGPQKLLQSFADPARVASAASPSDPLGRSTPRGSIFGFLEAVQNSDYARAASYLQLSKARRATQGDELARQTQAVLDRAFVGSLRAVSDSPEGTPQVGLRRDRERLGMLTDDSEQVEFVLARVDDPDFGPVWLISSETLARVPEVYEQLQIHQVETHLPKTLVSNELLGMPWWQWLALILLVPIAVGLAWVLVALALLPRRLWGKPAPTAVPRTHGVSGPAWLLVATFLHAIGTFRLKLPLLHRHYYVQVSSVVLVIGGTWLVWRIFSNLMQRVRLRALAAGRSGTGSLMVLGQRIVKAILVLVAVFGVLGSLGFNLTTALAGLGIGGIAVAFAAQKTLENLFGGISVLGDEVIRIGDVCRFGDKVGTIEDISLRSTRIRTVERTELSIPNGALATMNVENLSRRDKILLNPKIGLRYETTPDQLRFVLAEIRRMLYEHPKVETGNARIRFATLDDSWFGLEMFCYILTADFSEFTAIREDILLRIVEIVNHSGTSFAFPSQTLYMSRDSGADAGKTARAEDAVERWRQNKELPFPDHAPGDISRFRGSISYPSPDSPSGKQP